MEILNIITLDYNMYIKITTYGVNFIKLIPAYDLDLGVILKIIFPEKEQIVLDKKWMKLMINHNRETVRFYCPSFLRRSIGDEVYIYSDPFAKDNEIGRISGNFNYLKNLVCIPKRRIKNPYFSKDGKLRIPFVYMKKKFPGHLYYDLYASEGITLQKDVINGIIKVIIFKGDSLVEGENASSFDYGEYEIISHPFCSLLEMTDNINHFLLKKVICNDKNIIIYFKERKNNERYRARNGRGVRIVRKKNARTCKKGNASI